MASAPSAAVISPQQPALKTLTSVVAQQAGASGDLSTGDMVLLFSTLSTAIKTIAATVARAGIDDLTGLYEAQPAASDPSRDTQKKLDVVANNILNNLLLSCGLVAVTASEEDDMPVLSGAPGAEYVVVFDPLDGSRNIEASIPTGTIFGIYRLPTPGSVSADGLPEALQGGSRLLAAGYSLYSSATMLVMTLGQGTQGFTLDPSIGEFVLTHPDLQIPRRGQIYSVNDARYFDWPKGLQRYIDTIRQGKGQNAKKYSARYICSLVGDLHRTLLYGGVAMNPRSHLRLVYEGNPLAFVTEQAGGKASDGKRRILGITPEKLHQRLPLFLGSPEDIDELESYGDVQQTGDLKYDV